MQKYIDEKLIFEFIYSNNLNKTKFCKLARISTKTFNKVLNGNINISTIVLFKIARAINKNIVEIIRKDY